MKRLIRTALAVAGCSLLAEPASAVLISATGTNPASGMALAAQADFTVVGANLQVVLTNTALGDVTVPSDVLTAVFFDITGGAVTLTRLSAVLTAGSVVFYDSAPPGGVVGGEWAYKAALSGAPGGATRGISSTGVGLFGPGDRFPGADLAPPAAPGGLQYGLVSAGDLSATGNTGVTGSGGLIRNSVTFTLGGLPGGFDLARIANVSFQYGTSLSEPNIHRTPEPDLLLLLGLGLFGAAASRRRRP